MLLALKQGLGANATRKIKISPELALVRETENMRFDRIIESENHSVFRKFIAWECIGAGDPRKIKIYLSADIWRRAWRWSCEAPENWVSPKPKALF